MTEDEQEYFDERAAMYEYKRHFNRKKAEHLALNDLFMYRRKQLTKKEENKS